MPTVAPRDLPEILVGPEFTGETNVTYISTVSVHTPKWEFDVECPGTSIRSINFKNDTSVEVEILPDAMINYHTSRPELKTEIKLESPELECEIPEAESVIGENTVNYLT